MKSGYLYVLIHPSDPNLFKIGQSIRHPEGRLTEHNTNYEEYTGKIVKETGQKWMLKTYISVPDPYWAEAVFWGATPLAGIPFLGGIEIQKMEWEWVQAGLDAAKKAGHRPTPGPQPDWVYAYKIWMNKRLIGPGITLVGDVRSKTGKSNFLCTNGHKWRTTPRDVAEDGEGCPKCGIGRKDPDEIWKDAKVGYLCLLIKPNQPGFIKIGFTYSKQFQEENLWGDWELHRYRLVEEPIMAETLIWELLGYPQLNDDNSVKIDLSIAEQAFRKVHYLLVDKIVLAEKAKEIY